MSDTETLDKIADLLTEHSQDRGQCALEDLNKIVQLVYQTGRATA